MRETVTLAQIEEQFPSEWVLIGDPETTEALEIVRGTVLWHSKGHDDLYESHSHPAEPICCALHRTHAR